MMMEQLRRKFISNKYTKYSINSFFKNFEQQQNFQD